MVLNIFQKVSKRYSTTNIVARRATNDELFGPSPEELQQLTKLTFKPKSFAKIISVLEHRFQQSDRHWRQKSKTLTILQYFMIHGSPLCFEWMLQNRSILERLCHFKYIDSNNNDQGSSVREKAESLLQVIQNPEKLEEAKKAYKEQREGVRKSIGTGRPSTQSRNTLEIIRDNIFDDSDPVDINGAFKSALGSPTPTVTNVAAPPLEGDANRSFGGLCVIEEEHL